MRGNFSQIIMLLLKDMASWLLVFLFIVILVGAPIVLIYWLFGEEVLVLILFMLMITSLIWPLIKYTLCQVASSSETIMKIVNELKEDDDGIRK